MNYTNSNERSCIKCHCFDKMEKFNMWNIAQSLSYNPYPRQWIRNSILNLASIRGKTECFTMTDGILLQLDDWMIYKFQLANSTLALTVIMCVCFILFRNVALHLIPFGGLEKYKELSQIDCAKNVHSLNTF